MSTPRTRQWKPLLGALVVAVALVAVVAWRAGVWNSSTVAVSRIASSQDGLNVKPGLDLYPPDQRVQLATVKGTSLDGKPMALSELAGKIVVINVWGSWCGPCRAETPDLVRVANETAGRGVRFVGIDTRDTLAGAQAFVRAFDVPYPSLNDPQGQVLLALKDVVPISVVPTTIVIDRNGRVAARVIGPVTYSTLKGLLEDELAAGGGGG